MNNKKDSEHVKLFGRAATRLIVSVVGLVAVLILYSKLSKNQLPFEMNLFFGELITIAMMVVVIFLAIFIIVTARTLYIEIGDLHKSIRKSSLQDLPDNEKSIFSPLVLNPVELSNVLHKRVESFFKKGNAAEEVAIDFVWLYNNGYINNDQAKAFREAFIGDRERGSYQNFMGFKKDVKSFIDKPTPIDNNDYENRYKQRGKTFGKFYKEFNPGKDEVKPQ